MSDAEPQTKAGREAAALWPHASALIAQAEAEAVEAHAPSTEAELEHLQEAPKGLFKPLDIYLGDEYGAVTGVIEDLIGNVQRLEALVMALMATHNPEMLDRVLKSPTWKP